MSVEEATTTVQKEEATHRRRGCKRRRHLSYQEIWDLIRPIIRADLETYDQFCRAFLTKEHFPVLIAACEPFAAHLGFSPDDAGLASITYEEFQQMFSMWVRRGLRHLRLPWVERVLAFNGFDPELALKTDIDIWVVEESFRRDREAQEEPAVAPEAPPSPEKKRRK